jgi:adenosine kinase
MGMGNPLLDISANVTQELLDKYDLKLDTAILAEDKHQPLYKELVDGYDVQYIAGGATQNSMRVAQWVLKKAGKPGMVAFMGCVGNDDYGRHLEECASKDGVLVHYMKDAEAPSGTCAALIVGGERSLVANLAAANNFKPSHLETEKAKEIVESAKFYVSWARGSRAFFDASRLAPEHAVILTPSVRHPARALNRCSTAPASF